MFVGKKSQREGKRHWNSNDSKRWSKNPGGGRKGCIQKQGGGLALGGVVKSSNFLLSISRYFIIFHHYYCWKGFSVWCHSLVGHLPFYSGSIPCATTSDPRTCAAQARPLQEAHAPQLESSPHCPQPEKGLSSSKDPACPKVNFFF